MTTTQRKLLLNSTLDFRTGCLEWDGSLDSRGYGQIYLTKDERPDPKRQQYRAHRISYEAFVKRLPTRRGHHGVVVRHTCDNRICINPEHLIAGTQSDNIKDAVEKGRIPLIARQQKELA